MAWTAKSSDADDGIMTRGGVTGIVAARSAVARTHARAGYRVWSGDIAGVWR
jgi:hypothetical protein